MTVEHPLASAALLSTSEVAQRLGVSRRRVTQYVTWGRLPAVRSGYHYRVTEEDLAEFTRQPHGWPKGRARGPRWHWAPPVGPRETRR